MKARILLLAVLVHFTSSSGSLAQGSGSRPNIIFILCDDLGYGDVGVFFQNARATANDRSEPWHVTPKLDAFADAGLRLPHHYCPAPVCAPSRASLLTGLHQGHANVRDNQFDKGLANNHTIATVLKQAGYATACIGKWGLQGSGTAPNWAAYPLNRGFDFYHGYIRHGDGHAHYPKEDGKQVWEMTTDITAQLDKCYTTDLFTARAKKWITDQRTANPAQPFFLYLSYDTPHAQLQLPTVAYPPGGGTSGGLQWTETPGAMINTAAGAVDSYYHPDYASATWDHDGSAATAEQAWPDVYQRYATDVRRIDDCIGDLGQLLTDLGIHDNTLVIFTTDNGPSKESYLPENYDPTFFNSFGPFDGIKRDCWEGGIRVGALVRWPAGITANRTSNLPCQFHDWLPTFADLAGISPPAKCDGVSLVPMLINSGVQKPPQVYVEYFQDDATPNYSEFQAAKRNRDRNQMQMIRIGDYVGTRYNVTAHADDFEIYNVVTNPQQTTNLAGSQASLQQQMKNLVLRMRRPDASAPRPYDAELVTGVAVPVSQGVEWKAFTQLFPWVPELTALSPTSSGVGARPSVAVRPRDDQIGLLFTGYLDVPADGAYTFHLTADTGALLRIHEATVIDADFGYAGGTEASGTIALRAGKHPYRLYYARGIGGTPALSLQWSSATIAKQPIPDANFTRYDATATTPPTAVDDSATTPQNTAVTIPALLNDSDDGTPQSLSITAISPPRAGTAVLAGDAITYTPSIGFLGEDSFIYTITDSTAVSTARVKVAVTFFNGEYWYPFNETTGTTTFEAGGGMPAALNNFANNPAQWVAGRFGRALQFDNVDDFVSVTGFTGILGTNARTCAAWIKTTASGGNKPIIAWGPNTSSAKWIFLMNTLGQIRVEITNGFIIGSRSVNDGQWHHVACTFEDDGSPNAEDIRLYVDGSLETVSSVTPFALNTSASGDVKIGTDIQNRRWNGTIDEARIYPRALTAAEIATLAAASPDQTTAAWQRRHFGVVPIDWLHDLDADGLHHLGEFAFGTQPHVNDASSVFPAVIPGGAGELQFAFIRRAVGTSALIYEPFFSPDLTNWFPLTEPAPAVIPAGDPNFESVSFALNPSAEEKKFFRVRVTLP